MDNEKKTDKHDVIVDLFRENINQSNLAKTKPFEKRDAIES